MPGTPLSLPEREEIAVSLIEDRSTSWAEIARRVRRHPTVSRLEVRGVLRDRVTIELRPGRSIEAIWADLVAEGVAGRVFLSCRKSPLTRGWA